VDRYVTMVIGTPLAPLCQDLLGLMRDAVEHGMLRVSGQHFLRPDIFLPDCV